MKERIYRLWRQAGLPALLFQRPHGVNRHRAAQRPQSSRDRGDHHDQGGRREHSSVLRVDTIEQ